AGERITAGTCSLQDRGWRDRAVRGLGGGCDVRAAAVALVDAGRADRAHGLLDLTCRWRLHLGCCRRRRLLQWEFKRNSRALTVAVPHAPWVFRADHRIRPDGETARRLPATGSRHAELVIYGA